MYIYIQTEKRSLVRNQAKILPDMTEMSSHSQTVNLCSEDTKLKTNSYH